MKLQKQDGPHCLVYAAAMCLGVPAQEIHDFLGHDGTEVWWPEEDNISELRGIHIEEVIDFALEKCHKVFYPINIRPMSAPHDQAEPKCCFTYSDEWMRNRFYNRILAETAILVTPKHALAWDGYKIYDPRGHIIEIDRDNDFNISEAWIMI